MVPLLLLFAVPLLLPAAGQWQRLRSPHFELLTDAREADAARVLDRLETVRHVFLESIGGKAPALPVRVFLFNSERDFRRIEPNRAVRGFHQGGPERDYIVLHSPGEETLRAARHEYLHVLLAHSSATLPMWLEEGTAELYSTLELRGPNAILGAPIAQHVRALQRLEWPPAELFLNANRQTPIYDDATHAGLFYAEAWAFVHMLNFSPVWRPHLPRFAELLDQGLPADFAFESAFSMPAAKALAALPNYVRDARFATAAVPMLPRSADQSAITATAIDPAVALVAQVELLNNMGARQGAAAMLERAAASLPPSPEIETARGLAALGQADRAAARQHFLRAMELGATSSIPSFEYAMLLRESGAAPDEVRKYLAEATGRNPYLAEAHFILGLMAQKENRHRDALAAFEQATAVLPRQSYFWHARALAHHALGQPDMARLAARRAAGSATTTAQLEMAQSALKLVGTALAPPAAAPPKPAVYVPESWKPREGATSVEGTLEQIDCLGEAARLQIRPSSGGAPVQLWVEKPGDVLLKDASSLTFTFQCGPQRPRRVGVEYDPKQGLPRGSVGLITAIRFL